MIQVKKIQSGVRLLMCALAIAAAAPRVAQGQSSPEPNRRNAFVLEANPFRGTLGYARRRASGWELGFSAGFGFPQLDQTLVRRDGDFRDYLHLGPFVRHDAGAHALVEVGVRVGVADYLPCTVSDCWPGAYAGPSVLVAVGGQRFKVGARITGGVISQPGHGMTHFVGVSPLNLVAIWRR